MLPSLPSTLRSLEKKVWGQKAKEINGPFRLVVAENQLGDRGDSSPQNKIHSIQKDSLTD